jgi:ATP/maltotriose-dependent transcriptional regulator MalT
MPNDKLISFQGTLSVEGDLAKLNMDELKEYLQRAVSLDIDTEEQGQLSDDVEVTGIGIDWESLKD